MTSAFEEKDYTKRFDLALWKKLLVFCKPYKKKIVMLGFFIIFMSVFDRFPGFEHIFLYQDCRENRDVFNL